ncbi:hypothetical protein HUG10_20455 (plasmid) [Halorarum halophilum]|uniref:Uncharacterized protein n=1 Tax=Halorarum halophilum TaxID=2743090 RepID=A0A7D5K3W8_9EURY|nr:hypothetical protein [Halobaculum halophilum]QLG29981.1 hypothetical protein HUG10_20455 [Halobaculum halophilum]
MVDTPRDRLGANLKTPYPDDDGTWWDHLLTTIGDEMDDLETVRQVVLDSKFLETATDAQLDRLGELVQLPREKGETNPHYRGRLTVELRAKLSTATVKEIKDTAATILEVESADIGYSEDFSVEAARFILDIDENVLSSAGVSGSEFVTFIDRVRGAGIRAEIRTKGTFTYRSEQEYISGTNNPANGYYDSADGITNGTYAGLVQ